jgi:hypothetical protein
MTPIQIAVVIVIVIAIIALAVAVYFQSRTKKLRAQFGPEYDRAVVAAGSKLKAEAELETIEKHVRRYPLRPLSTADRDRFQQSWRAIQAAFVDNPQHALSEADLLVTEVMSTLGYPMNDFEHRATEIAVDHVVVVDHYRAGHEIAIRHARGQATTEDLRQGMIHYRALFDRLMDEQPLQIRTQAAGRT